MRPARRSEALIAASLVALLLFLCGAYLLGPALHARNLFHELETLQLGHSTFEDAQRLARRIGAKPTGPCHRSSCEWEKAIDNRSLPRWWRRSGAGFLVSWNLEDSVVVRKNTGFGIGLFGSFHPSQVGLEEQENWGRGNTRMPVQAGWYTTDLYRYYSFRVRMTPKASSADRRRYTAYNYSCLWKYGGCRDARDLLPTADPLDS